MTSNQPDDDDGLKRYGFREPLDTRPSEMADGYWTPWHVAQAEVEQLTDVLRRNGFRECDIPVCNCGSWHHVGGFAERFREIDEATADDERNGETLLTRIGRIVADRERLRAALTDIAEPKGMDNESENALRRHIARRALEGAASVAPAERKP